MDNTRDLYIDHLEAEVETLKQQIGMLQAEMMRLRAICDHHQIRWMPDNWVDRQSWTEQASVKTIKAASLFDLCEEHGIDWSPEEPE